MQCNCFHLKKSENPKMGKRVSVITYFEQFYKEEIAPVFANGQHAHKYTIPYTCLLKKQYTQTLKLMPFHVLNIYTCIYKRILQKHY